MRKENVFDKLISLQDAANLLGVSDSFLRAEIRRGNLIKGIHCQKYGKQWVVCKEAFLKQYRDRRGRLDVQEE